MLGDVKIGYDLQLLGSRHTITQSSNVCCMADSAYLVMSQGVNEN